MYGHQCCLLSNEESMPPAVREMCVCVCAIAVCLRKPSLRDGCYVIISLHTGAHRATDLLCEHLGP